ncbi:MULTISPECIES: hypothetical protein [unclassified Streptomyces]|uniref:hypothetical protein n=1 Tax=unclassified Streptomyces TaxID=2593676 RepID=UPI00381DFD91
MSHEHPSRILRPASSPAPSPSDKAPSQQALTFLRKQLPPSIDVSLPQARVFVRTTATVLGWQGDVETAAHTAAALVRNAADCTRESFCLGLAVDTEGSLLIEVEDGERDFADADHVARLLFFLVGARVSWGPTVGGRVVRAVMPMRQAVRAGGVA